MPISINKISSSKLSFLTKLNIIRQSYSTLHDQELDSLPLSLCVLREGSKGLLANNLNLFSIFCFNSGLRLIIVLNALLKDYVNTRFFNCLTH